MSPASDFARYLPRLASERLLPVTILEHQWPTGVGRIVEGGKSWIAAGTLATSGAMLGTPAMGLGISLAAAPAVPGRARGRRAIPIEDDEESPEESGAQGGEDVGGPSLELFDREAQDRVAGSLELAVSFAVLASRPRACVAGAVDLDDELEVGPQAVDLDAEDVGVHERLREAASLSRLREGGSLPLFVPALPARWAAIASSRRSRLWRPFARSHRSARGRRG